MTNEEKLDYAQMRARGAAMFEHDQQKTAFWMREARRLRKLIVKESEVELYE